VKERPKVKVSGAPGYRDFEGELMFEPFAAPWTGKRFGTIGYYSDELGWEVDLFNMEYVTYVTDN
jgi:hypothetical protein